MTYIRRHKTTEKIKGMSIREIEPITYKKHHTVEGTSVLQHMIGTLVLYTKGCLCKEVFSPN